jgi:hypothetical protein
MAGVFGIPLEVLVERNGSDSVMASGHGSLRIPAFVDDSISAMRQMGIPYLLFVLIQICRLKECFEKMGIYDV